MASNRPGILDEGFLENIPNVLPAGEAPWLKNNPALTLPAAGEVRPEWNSVWIRPGMLLEPGSGFGTEGRSSALQALDFPTPGFLFPPLFGVQGSQPPVPPPSEQNPAGEGDYLAQAIGAGAKVLGELGKTLTPKTTSFSPGVVEQWRESVFGPEPEFDLSGNVTQGGKPPIEGTPFFEDQFTLFPETGGASVTGLSPATIAAIQDYEAMRAATPLLSGSSPFFEPNRVNDILGLGGPTPSLSLTGTVPQGLDTTGMTLSGGAPMSVGSTTGTAAGATTAGTSVLGGPLMAAGAALPWVAKAAGANEDISQGAQVAGAGLAATGAGLSLAGGAAGLAALGPAAAFVSLPLILGPILNNQLRKNGIWGRDPSPPPGFMPTPWDLSKGRNPGVYVNPLTGVIIQRKGNRAKGFDLSAQSKTGQPITPDQARQWGIPIPGIDLTIEQIKQSNPDLYTQLQGLSQYPVNLFEMQEMGADALGVSPTELTSYLQQMDSLKQLMAGKPQQGGWQVKQSQPWGWQTGKWPAKQQRAQINTGDMAALLDPRWAEARATAERLLREKYDPIIPEGK